MCVQSLFGLSGCECLIVRGASQVLGDTDYSTVEELASDPDVLLSNMPAVSDLMDHLGELVDMNLDEALGVGSSEAVTVARTSLRGREQTATKQKSKPQVGLVLVCLESSLSFDF